MGRLAGFALCGEEHALVIQTSCRSRGRRRAAPALLMLAASAPGSTSTARAVSPLAAKHCLGMDQHAIEKLGAAALAMAVGRRASPMFRTGRHQHNIAFFGAGHPHERSEDDPPIDLSDRSGIIPSTDFRRHLIGRRTFYELQEQRAHSAMSTPAPLTV